MTVERTTQSHYESRRCASVSPDGLRCQREHGHLGERDVLGRRAPQLHRSTLQGRQRAWQED